MYMRYIYTCACIIVFGSRQLNHMSNSMYIVIIIIYYSSLINVIHYDNVCLTLPIM